MEAFLQHGAWGGPYRTESVPVRRTETPCGRHRNVTGYGTQIPTGYMVQWEGRWRRVYLVCFSNSGTAYIKGPRGESDIVVRVDS